MVFGALNKNLNAKLNLYIHIVRAYAFTPKYIII